MHVGRYLSAIRQGLVARSWRIIWTSLTTMVILAALALLMAASNDPYQIARTNLHAFSNYLSILPAPPHKVGGNTASRGHLYDRDVATIQEGAAAKGISAVIPYRVGNAVFRYGSQSFTAQMIGSSNEYAGYQNLHLSSGVMFTGEHYASATRVVLLGDGIAQSLFGDSANAVNSYIFIGRGATAGGRSYKVLGVIDTPRLHNQALMPLSTARDTLFGRTGKVQGIAVRVIQPDNIPQVIANISEDLDKTHHVKGDPLQRDWGFDSETFIDPKVPDILSAIQRNDLTMIMLLIACGIMCIILIVRSVGKMPITYLDGSMEKFKPADICGTFVIEVLVITAAGWIGWIEGSLLIPWLLNNHWLYGEPVAYVDSIYVPEFFGISENAIDLPILPLLSGVLAIIASAYSAFRDSRARASIRERV